MFSKFIAFALVGVLGTLVHYAILYTLVEFNAVNPVSASGWGALSGLIVNYVLNFKLTFNSQQTHARTFPKFALIAGFGFALNLALMTLLTEHIYYLYAQILTTVVVLFWNFFANMFWTFNKDYAGNRSKEPSVAVLQNVRSGLGLLLILFVIRLCTLGLYPLYDPSESRYAEMARKMLETGNWVTPLIDYGVPFWGKPPLTIWLTAFSLGLGGINEFSARLPSLALGAGIVWLVFNLAKVQRSFDSAILAAIMLAGSVLFFVMSGTVAMDQCLTFGMTLTLASFWLALREDKPLWGYLFFIGLSIGLLAKGPIAIVLAGLTIGTWTLISRRWLDSWKRLPWIKGSLLMLCITLPWYLLAEQKTPGFLEYFIIGEHWKRFTESGWKGDLYGAGRGHVRGMIWIYWLAAGFPWTLVVLQKLISTLLRREGRALLQANDDGWRLYCLLWMLAPLVFFTFSANIIWTYVLPGLPGLALLLCDGLEVSKKYRTALTLSVPLSFSGLVLIYHVSNVEFFKSQQILVNAYQQQAAAGENLIYMNNKPYSAQFYLHGKVLMVSGQESLKQSLTESTHNFYIIHQNDLDKFPNDLKARLVKVKSYAKFVLLHATSGN